jgi:hypothetical protein
MGALEQKRAAAHIVGMTKELAGELVRGGGRAGHGARSSSMTRRHWLGSPTATGGSPFVGATSSPSLLSNNHLFRAMRGAAHHTRQQSEPLVRFNEAARAGEEERGPNDLTAGYLLRLELRRDGGRKDAAYSRVMSV